MQSSWQVNFCTTKKLNLIWLFALFVNALSIAVYADVPKIEAETVYCPLTKKQQPVKAPQKEAQRGNALNEICADGKDKKSFADAALSRFSAGINLTNDAQFEKLAFDFFKTGEAAFANLPKFPEFPRKSSVKSSQAAALSGKTVETRIGIKPQSENFSFAQNPRPPSFQTPVKFDFQITRRLETVARNVRPRSPPFSV